MNTVLVGQRGSGPSLYTSGTTGHSFTCLSIFEMSILLIILVAGALLLARFPNNDQLANWMTGGAVIGGLELIGGLMFEEYFMRALMAFAVVLSICGLWLCVIASAQLFE
mgnify:CR=1 FL=1